MGVDNLTHVRKGQRLSAYTVNSIIDAVKGMEKPGNFKPGKSIRAQTLFYTSVAIPPYSIFPLIPNATSTYDIFYAKYTVEKYTASHSDQYIPGLYGTNGRLTIPAGVAFFGNIITSDWDSPIVVSDYANNAKKCGFKENSWEATITTSGLFLNGKAPQGEKTYYSRTVSSGEVKDQKFIGLCESASSELKFTKCSLNGQRTTYDEDEQITASVPPYIDAVEQGGYYLIDWFSEYNCWVVIAGTCAEDNREYQPYTTVSLTQHVKDGTSSGSTPLSGTAVVIGEHDEYATLETNLIWTQDLVGYPGRSSNMFFQAPTFALNSNRDAITFSGLKLNPGATGIVVYQFVVTNCNGSCRDVYTVAFKLIEENSAPEVTMSQTNFTLQPDGTFDGDIGTVTQTGQDANDTLVIYDKQITGDSNILATNTLTVNQSTGKIHLYLKASDTNTGTCQIAFYIDDSHDLTATTGEYEQVVLNITVEQTTPTTAS